ncbi:MAG: hypothetical protein AAFZ07_12915 [Actinomycetota bacterium]
MAAVATLAACGGGGGDDADSAPSSTVEAVASVETTPPPTTLPTTTTTEPPPLTVDDALTTGGLGEVRLGMTVGEAEVASGRLMDLPPGVEESPCYEVTARDLPGVSFVVVDGRIRVIDVRDPGFATSSGARIGMSADEIRALFGERIDETPIEGSSALTFVPSDANDPARVVFFSDGTSVTRMLSGTVPHVLSLDACAEAGVGE